MFRPVAFRLTLSLIATLAATPAFAQQSAGRVFGIDDALNVRTSRIGDVSADGRWIALTITTRRDALGVDNSRYGDPSYVTPALAEFQLVDATTGQSRTVVPGKAQVRNATFTKDGRQLAFFTQKGDDWSVNIYDVAAGKTKMIALHTSRQVASNSPLVWAPPLSGNQVPFRSNPW